MAASSAIKKETQPPQQEILNEDVLKGTWIDGIGLHVGGDYVILDGLITPPRTDKNYIVARIMFPTRILGELAKSFEVAVKKREEIVKKREKQSKK